MSGSKLWLQKKTFLISHGFFPPTVLCLFFLPGVFHGIEFPRSVGDLQRVGMFEKWQLQKNGKGQFLKDEAVDSVDVICHISKYLDVQVIFIWTIPQQSAWILPAVTCTKAP